MIDTSSVWSEVVADCRRRVLGRAVAALVVGLLAAGCVLPEPEDLTAPDTGWVARWTKLDNPDVRVRTLVVSDGDRLLYDGDGIKLRDRDYNFAFWNGGTQLYAYSSDVGGTVVTFTEDGSSYKLTTGHDDGHCLDLDDRVELDDKQQGLIPQPCA